MNQKPPLVFPAQCQGLLKSTGQAYTLDGQGAGEIEAETFSADKATVTITGANIAGGAVGNNQLAAGAAAANLAAGSYVGTFTAPTGFKFTTRFAALWEQDGGLAWQARHGIVFVFAGSRSVITGQA